MWHEEIVGVERMQTDRIPFVCSFSGMRLHDLMRAHSSSWMVLTTDFEFLIGKAPHTEIAVTYSKQTTAYSSNRGQTCIPVRTKVVDVPKPSGERKA